MSKQIRVYNKGIRPIVYNRERGTVEAIHPNKFLVFSEETATAIIEKFSDACTQEDFEKSKEKPEAAPKKSKSGK